MDRDRPEETARIEEIAERVERVRVVYTDVDGTLVSDGCLFRNRDGPTLTKAEAIYRLGVAGVSVVMTSGRDHRRLRGTARLLGTADYIGNLGLEIALDGGAEIVHNYGLDLGDADGPRQWIDDSGVLDALFERYPDRIRPYEPWAETLHTHHLLVGDVDAEDVDSWLRERFPDLRLVDNGRVPAEPEFPSPHAYHLLPRRAGKASAVALHRERRGFARDEAVALGDSVEDRSMAAEVGVFFALDPALSADDPSVVPVDNRDHDGFARVVRSLLEAGLVGDP